MAQDVKAVLETVYPASDNVGIVLMGHSMGGALAAQVVEAGVQGLVGLIVEDVVEGTAIEALASMHTVLQNRPKQFQSLEQAVEWCVRSGQVRILHYRSQSIVIHTIFNRSEIWSQLECPCQVK